jgi:hypothetical protein
MALFKKCHFYCQDYVARSMLITISISMCSCYYCACHSHKQTKNHKSNYQQSRKKYLCVVSEVERESEWKSESEQVKKKA